ncbi:hypothetical protein [Burkholderia cenocepacia]|uniref:hypothetical protein n=1 Tax=Burkholderia cenocepacia TaxID=95486 RepID=UPI00358EDC16
MATNDFLVFGGGSSPNVIDQATYAALAARLSGFQSGTALSAQLNKVWRQSSIASAVLAQFIVDMTGQNATDDGTTGTLLANLKSAVPAAVNAVGVNSAKKINGINSPNLLFNGSGEFGNAGWNGNALNVIIGSNGEGAILVNQSSISGAFAIYSNSVACTASQPFTLSGLVATPGVSAGSLVLQIVFQNSSGDLISSIATPLVNASGAWISYSASGNAPTGAALMYAQISGGAGSTISSGGLFFRRMKLESGLGTSLYSQEASITALGVGPNSAPVFVGQATQSGHAVQRSQSIGNGATVLSTPSRVVGTTYTNSTGRPLFVLIYAGSGNGNNTNGSGYALSVNGVVVSGLFGPITNGVSISGAISAIVPPGATYVLNNTGLGLAAFSSWTEY